MNYSINLFKCFVYQIFTKFGLQPRDMEVALQKDTPPLTRPPTPHHAWFGLFEGVRGDLESTSVITPVSEPIEELTVERLELFAF